MLLFKLARLILNALRPPECKGQPMSKEDAAALVAKKAAAHPEAMNLDTSSSIVDALKACELDSSFPTRVRLWHHFKLDGIYKGSAEQNLTLLDRFLETVAENDVDSLRDA